MIEYISTTSKKTLFIVEYSNQYKPPITYKNIRLMLEFLKAPFFVLHFSYYTLMNFLMMLSVTVQSMLMILLSTLKCDQASDLWQQLSL